MKCMRLTVTAVLTCLLTMTSVRAALVIWDVNATFDDGGRAIGSFQYDAAKFAATGNGLGDFDILTTRGAALAGTNYLNGSFISSASAKPLLIDITNDLGRLVLQPSMVLSADGSVIPLSGGSEDFGNLGSRSVTGGDLMARVPEPSELGFLLLGLAALISGAAAQARKA